MNYKPKNGKIRAAFGFGFSGRCVWFSVTISRMAPNHHLDDLTSNIKVRSFLLAVFQLSPNSLLHANSAQTTFFLACFCKRWIRQGSFFGHRSSASSSGSPNYIRSSGCCQYMSNALCLLERLRDILRSLYLFQLTASCRVWASAGDQSLARIHALFHPWSLDKPHHCLMRDALYLCLILASSRSHQWLSIHYGNWTG